MLKRGMGLLGLSAILLMTVPAVSVQASEPGVITALSEKVYLEKSIGSTVLANVLQGSTVEIIFTEMDDAGGLWFYIRTDTGLEGYLPAQSATAVSSQTEQVQPAQEQPKEEQPNEELPKDDEQQPENDEAQTEYKITTLDNVNIRENPTVDSRIKGNIPQGTEVGYTRSVRNEQDEVWYAVTYQGIDGYITESAVNADLITDSSEEIETVEQEETAASVVEAAEPETKAEPLTYVAEKDTQQESEPFSEETVQVKSHYKIRLPEKFEILLSLGVIACCAIVAFLLKKIKRML